MLSEVGEEMSFSPILGSQQIQDQYKRYLTTMFHIDNTEYQKQFSEQIQKENIFSNGPYLEAHDNYLTGKTIREHVENGTLPASFLDYGFYLDRPLYKHQEKALLKAAKGENLVVSTGTGSGKTESFLIPILAELGREKEAHTLSPGVRALLIYPMNALANDQIERLRDLLEHTPEITFGSYTGQTKQRYADALAEYEKLNRKKPPKNELISREQMKRTPPHILVTNYAMLEYLMVRPGDKVFFNSETWKFVVLDEAHVYRGSTGIEVSMLLRRLKAVLKGCTLQYFITSATLGDESENREVAEFATNLCNSTFVEDNVIRAMRVQVPEPQNALEVPYDVYEQVSGYIDAEWTQEQIGEKLAAEHAEWNLDGRHPLFDMVHRDRTFWNLRKYLKKPRSIQEIVRSQDISSDAIEKYVTVASLCEAEGIRLLDARYHMFLRATDSVFVTLPPSNKLLLTRAKTVLDSKTGISYKVFEANTCSSCHSVYLIGSLNKNTNCIEQNSTGENREIYFLGSQVFNTDEDSMDEESTNEPGKVCAICGFFMRSSVKNSQPCSHGNQYMVPVVKLKTKGPDHKLRKCVNCESVNTRGILRPFFTGQEAVTSVLATSLFNTLPSTVVHDSTIMPDEIDEFGFEMDAGTHVVEKENKARQFLCFSDSRQASAYFASYLDITYRKMLYKRCIVETLYQQPGERHLQEFCEDLTAIFENSRIQNGTELRPKKESWKAILAEAADQTGDSSLSGLGIMKIGLEKGLFQRNDKLGLSEQEVNDLFNVLIDGMIMDLAITIPIAMTVEDREFYAYGANHGFYTMIGNNSVKAKNFIPSQATRSNKRQDYLLRVFEKKMPGFLTVDKARKLLEGLWKQLQQKKIIISVEGNCYQINSESLYIHQPNKWYRCDKCHKLTPYNIANVCPTYRCSGRLFEVSPNDEYKDNHYYRLYHDMDMQPLRVKEHTAQLDRNKAYEYQQDFKRKKIDVLSCSTTFEMGVDVGSLETVFMRNMPPMPSNYTQRAGRAGRSKNSAAFALTFCNRSNHDFSYFNRPLDMISGKIHAPHFNINNEKIAIRHIYASALSFFWRKNESLFSTVKKMTESGNDENKSTENGVELFERYLREKPDDLRQYLLEAFPKQICDVFGVDDYSWIDGLIGNTEGNEGALTRAINEYTYEVGILEKARMDAFINHKSTSYYESRLRNYWSEDILSFLSRHNVMPQYGFPVDTVSMTVSSGKDGQTYGVELSRDMAIAISEYAPGSQVVANGLLFTGRYIKRVPRIGWKTYDYNYCKDCETINIDPHTNESKNSRLQNCKMCGAPLEQKDENVFIIPSFGFEADPEKVSKPTLIRPERTYRTDVSYVGYRADIEMVESKVGRSSVLSFFSAKDEMAVLNQSDFYVCEACGYADQGGFTKFLEKEHTNSSGKKCINKILRKYSLGYRFETDVFLLVFTMDSVDYINNETAYSVLYALIRGAVETLDLEESDIAGCLQKIHKNSYRNTCFILYDTTPGGAGHVRRLNDPVLLERAIEKGLKIMKNCTCGGKEGHSSCYACLRSYRNQKIHDILDRSLAIDFLSTVF